MLQDTASHQIQSSLADIAQTESAAESSDEPARTGPVSGLSQTNEKPKRRKPVSTRAFKRQLTEAMPNLRAFAYSLCGRADLADDLAQETAMKAWAARDRFKPGSSLKAWAFTILRNTYLSQMRRRKFKGDYDEIAAERILSAPAEQPGPMHLTDVQRALMELPENQREAVMLVGAGGYSYEAAADICDAATGTMKSRVSRGRKTLEGIFDDGKIKGDRADASDASDVASDILDAVDQLADGEDISALMPPAL